MITQEEIDNFIFIHQRLIKVYKESENIDYLQKMKSTIDKMKQGQTLPIDSVVNQRELLLCGVCDEETKHDTTLRHELHCLKCGNVAKE